MTRRYLSLLATIVAVALATALLAGFPAALAGLLIFIVTLFVVTSLERMFFIFFLIDLGVRTASHFVESSLVSSLDDVSALALAGVLVGSWLTGRQRIRLPIASWSILAFGVCGVLSALVEAVPYSTWLPGLYLACKGFLVALAAANINWVNASRSRYLRACVAGLLVVVATSAVINLAVPGVWSATFSVSGSEIFRYGLPSLIGPFIHPFDLALTSAIFSTCCGAYLLFVRVRPLAVFSLVLFFAILLLTFRRKELAGAVLVLTALVLLSRRGRLKFAAIAGLPLAALLLGPVVSSSASDLYSEYVVDGSDAARTVLTLGSVELAVHHMPLGVGFGRFASRTAAVQYSPVYAELGYDSVWGLQNNASGGSFLTDTSWPAVIGETGFLGTLFFALPLLVAFIRAAQAIRFGPPQISFLGAIGLSILGVCVVSSTAAPIFTSPPGFGLTFGALGLVSTLARPAAPRSMARPPVTGIPRKRAF